MVTGVVGGMIDVNGLVSQLMQVERLPLDRLERRETQIQSRLSAFGRISGALSALDAALNTLSRAASFSAGKATVTGEGVAAVVSGTPATGRYAVSVTQLARAQSTASARIATAGTDIGSGTVTIRNADGSEVLGTFNVGDSGTGTLTELRDEINAANIGVRASLVGDAGQVRLVLNSKETGAANAFTVETDAGLAALAFAEQQAAQDASFSVNGLALTSASNVVRDAIEGVALSLTKAPPAGSPVGTTVDGEVVVETDSEKVAASINDFVKAYNDVDKLIAELTKYDPNTKTAAILNGESVLRRMQGDLRSLVRGTMTAAVGDFSRLSEVGISFAVDGTLKLDEKKIADLAAADPAKLVRLFTATSETEAEQGFAVRLRARVRSFVEPAGLLQARQDGLRASIRVLDQQQERMEARLVLIEERLRRQYSQLDALMTSRQSQSNALANALAGLPSTQG
jgi:flagellar hook-associated protein 2